MNHHRHIVQEFLEGGTWSLYVPKYPSTASSHDVAEYTVVLQSLLDKATEVGYSNPTLVLYKGWAVEIMVDEDDLMYTWPHNGRPSLFELAQHAGIGAGCGNGYSAQLYGFTTFLDRGIDETHGRRSWDSAPCRECFPARHAAAKAAAAKCATSVRQVGRRR